MSDKESNGQMPEQSALPSGPKPIRTSNAFMANKSYYFLRSLLFGFLYFLLVLAVLVMLAMVGVGIWVKKCNNQISLEEAKSAQSVKLAGWLAFNHLETQEPEVRARLLKKYVARMKAIDRKDLSSPAVMKAMPYIKQLAQEYSKDQKEKLENWEQGTEKSRGFQRRYKIEKTSEGDYILSTDILPTDFLIEEVSQQTAGREAGKLPSLSGQSRIEANIRTLAKEWFLRQMRGYDKKSDSAKAEFIADSARTLNHFSSLYNEALVELGLPAQRDVEQLRNLNYLTSGWIDTSTPEELARLYWFKDLIISASIAERSNKSADSLESLIRYSGNDDINGLFKAVFGSRPDRSEQNEEKEGESVSENAEETEFF